MEVAGIITGSIGAGVSLITLAMLFIRGVFAVEHRLTRLETQMEPFWDTLRQVLPSILGKIPPPTNPITSDRWQYLLNKLQSGQITGTEAHELQGALTDMQQKAKEKDDLTVLLAIGLGLALLAILASKK